jgi:hypothetical protein
MGMRNVLGQIDGNAMAGPSDLQAEEARRMMKAVKE